MSFSRVSPAGWAANFTLTSAQMNELDVEHTNLLDKTTAGDTIAGSITLVPPQGQINLNAAGQFLAGTLGGMPGSAGALVSTAPGGIQQEGGPNDWISFSATRSRVLDVPMEQAWGSGSTQAVAAGTLTATYLRGGVFLGGVPFASLGTPPYSSAYAAVAQANVNTANANQLSIMVALGPSSLHNGATLTQAVLTLIGAAGHAALPQSMPAFGIYRATVTSPGSAPVALKSGTSFVVDGSATVGAYQATHTITFTPNQVNVIDTTQNFYYAIIWDEGGTNALGNSSILPDRNNGTLYSGMQLTYSSISNMAFP